MKGNKIWKKALCLVLAVAMVLGNASPVAAAHEHKTAAEIVTEITNATIKEAEKVIDKTGLLNAADVTDTKDALESASGNLEGSMGNLGVAVENAEATIEALDGKVTKDDAAEINASLSVAYGEASDAYTAAVAAAEAASKELESAGNAYDAANKISDEAAKIAEAELKAAQEALNAAVEAAKFANDNMTNLKNEFAKATELASKWNAEAEAALAEATAKFEAAKTALDNALVALETENAELKAAIDTFKACYDAFITAANTFKTSIQDAIDAQDKLEALYAEYEAAQAAYAEALAAYEAKCAEYEADGYPADYDSFKAETDRLNGELQTANDALEAAEAAYAEAEKTYNFYEERVTYLESLQEKSNIITSETATEEEKAEAAYSTAEIIVEQFIVAENIVNNTWSEDTQVIKVPATGSEYGKADYPFFVVIGENVVTRNVDNKFVIRYGYEINEETGAVEVFELVAVDRTDYIEYNGVEYELEEKNDGLFITVDGSKIDIYKEGTRYFEKITLDGQFVEDNTEIPTKVNVAAIIDVEVEKIPDWAINLVKGISWVDLQYNEESKYYYAFVGVELLGQSWGFEFPIDLVQDSETGVYTAEYNYEVDIYAEECSNANHLLANDHGNRVCINTTHVKNGHHATEGTVCTNTQHTLGKDDDGNCIVYDESVCVNPNHTETMHDVEGPCKNQAHIDNKVCAQFLEGCQNEAHKQDADGNCIVYDESVCVNPNHTETMHDEEGTKCITQAHVDSADCTRYRIVCTNGSHIGHDSLGFARKHSNWIGDYTDYSENCLKDFGKCTYEQYGKCEPEYLGDCEKGKDYGVCDKDYYGKCEPKYLGECTYDQYGECEKVWAGGCTYAVIGTEARVLENVPCKFPVTKPQAKYADVWYDVDVENNKIVADGTEIKFTESEAGKSYTYQVNVKFVEGGDADTFYARKASRSEGLCEDLASLIQKKADALTAYDTATKNLETAVTVQEAAQAIYDDYSAKLAEFEPVYNTYAAAEKLATEKELGALADLPKNIGELVEGLEIEEMLTLLDAIVKLSSQSGDVDYKEVLEVLSDVVESNAATRLIAVLAYDAISDGLGSISPFGLFDDIMDGIGGIIDGIGEQITPPTKFEREYAEAWVDALTTKIKVVQNAIKLVETAVDTVEAGVTAITEGIELAEVAVDAVLATAEKKMLEAVVDVLVMANDILGTSEEVVLSIDSIIAEAHARTEKAYLAAVAERNALNQVTFTRPYAAKLDEALVAIGSANALNAELKADIAAAEVTLTTVKALYEELKYLEEHEHVYESVVTAPTCTKEGYTTHTCTVCSYTYTDSEVPATGHSYETTTVDATCTMDGSITDVCAVCGDTKVETIPATGHTYEVVVTEPTCTTKGYTTHTCACGDVYTDEEVDALGHSFKSVVTEPTCTVDGYTTHTCSVCNESYKDSTVTAPGHTWGEWVTTSEPSEDAFGEKVRECTVEGCEAKEVVSIEKLPHTHVWDEGAVKAPTCTEVGYTTYTCTKETCQLTEVRDEVAALGHDYVVTETAPTCTEDGYFTHACSRCDDAYTTEGGKATGHSFGEWKETTPAEEGVPGEATRECHCGATETQVIPALGHDYVATVTEPTCTEQGYTTYTCACGDSYVADYVDALGHTEDAVVTAPTCEAEGYTTYTCSVCGASRTADTVSALGHDYVPAVTAPTCTAEGYTTYTCSRGDHSYVADYVEALGHSFGEWTVEENATCTEDGKEARICGTCGEKEERTIEALGHAYDAVVTAPTCVTGGYTTYTCSVCGDSYVADEVAAKGHSYDVRVTEPTCTTGGHTTYVCACGVYETGYETEALGHTWGAWTVTTAATETATGLETRECAICHATEVNVLAMLEAAPVADETVEIEEEETPLANGEEEKEDDETIVIEDEETPLSDGSDMVEIEEEEVPLSDGNNSNVGMVVAVVGGVAVAGTGAAVVANQAGLLGTGAASAAATGTAAGTGVKGLWIAIAAFFKKLFRK